MKPTLTFLFLLAALLMPGHASAQTYSVVSDGLTLNFTVSGTEATITETPDKVYGSYTGYILSNGGTVKIPATVSVGSNTYTVTKIGNNAFYNCSILSLTLPSTLKEIGKEAFYHGNGNIEANFDELLIPASVQRLGERAFGNQRIKHLSVESGSQLSFIGSQAFATYRPAKKSIASPTSSYEYNIEYYDFSNTNLVAASFANSGWGQQFTMFSSLQGQVLMYLPASFDIYPCGSLNDNSGNVIQTASETNIVRASGYCDNLLISDDMSFRAPKPFTAKNATYNRTFSNVAGKAVSTLYLPYPTDLPTGMCAYYLTKKGTDKNGDKAFFFASLPTGTRLEANKPYLVQITDGASHTLPEMHNVVVPATPDIETTAVMASSDTDWKFYGTTEFINNAAAYTKKAYYLNGNKWWAVQNGVTNDFIAPFRCFISSPTNATPAKGFVMVLEDDTTADGIKTLEAETGSDIRSGRYPFYSIDGTPMGSDYDALESGQIYVVNGKKFYKL